LTRSAPGYALVIFDCDGVLVDSEPIANRVFAEMLAGQGLGLSPRETMRRCMGRSMAACRALIEGELGRALPRDFFNELHARTLVAFQNELRPVVGIVRSAQRGRTRFVAWRSSPDCSSRELAPRFVAPTRHPRTRRPRR